MEPVLAPLPGVPGVPGPVMQVETPCRINFEQLCTFLCNVYNNCNSIIVIQFVQIIVIQLVQFVQFVQFYYILSNFRKKINECFEQFGNYIIEQYIQNIDSKILFKIAYDIHQYYIQYCFQYYSILLVIVFITLLKIVCNLVCNITDFIIHIVQIE